MRVINIFGSPGSGKSTTAAGLFYTMKIAGYKVELAWEAAKDLVYENRMQALQNQTYVFGDQVQRLERLRGKVDWVVTDSPIILSSIYAPTDYPESFHALVWDLWRRYDNHCFLMERVNEYEDYGRYHDEGQSQEIDRRIRGWLDARQQKFSVVEGRPDAPKKIASELDLDLRQYYNQL